MDPDGMVKLAWNQIRSSLVDLAMPAQCVNCGVWDSWLCPACAGSVGGNLLRRQIAVGGMSGVSFGTVSATPYNGLGKRVVLAHKDRGLRSLALVMAGWLAPAIESVAPQSGLTWLVPVPATARSRRKRGRDSWLEVCLAVAELLGPDIRVAQMLAWRTRVHPQKELSRIDRAENVGGKIVCRSQHGEELLRVPDAVPALILVDDVVTTGATLRECARALFEAGMVCSGAATVCAVAGE